MDATAKMIFSGKVDENVHSANLSSLSLMVSPLAAPAQPLSLFAGVASVLLLMREEAELLLEATVIVLLMLYQTVLLRVEVRNQSCLSLAHYTTKVSIRSMQVWL